MFKTSTLDSRWLGMGALLALGALAVFGLVAGFSLEIAVIISQSHTDVLGGKPLPLLTEAVYALRSDSVPCLLLLALMPVLAVSGLLWSVWGRRLRGWLMYGFMLMAAALGIASLWVAGMFAAVMPYLPGGPMGMRDSAPVEPWSAWVVPGVFSLLLLGNVVALALCCWRNCREVRRS